MTKEFAAETEVSYNANTDLQPTRCSIVGVDLEQETLHACLGNDGTANRTLCGLRIVGKKTSYPIRFYGNTEYQWCEKCGKRLIEHLHFLPAWENRKNGKCARKRNGNRVSTDLQE